MRERTKWQSFRQRAYLLRLLVGRNIKNQYFRSVLGIVWTVLHPLLDMVVLSFVFMNIFGRTDGELFYPVYILSGRIIFGFLTSATTSALPCFVNQSGLIQKTNVPLEIFPMASVFSAVVNFAFSLIALILVMLICIPKGVSFYWEMVLIVTILPALILFAMGLSFILSCLYVFFRDIKHIWGVFVTLWMYLTPIFYTLSSLSSTMQTVVKLNPMYHFVTAFRQFLQGTIPDWKTFLIMYGVGILFFVLGLFFMKCVKKSIAVRL